MSDARQQFGRIVRTIVGPIAGSSSSVSPLAMEFTTRTSFVVRKTSSDEPNVARISIFNLNLVSRSWLEAKNQMVWLQAGYAVPQTIFFGRLERLKIIQRSGDIVADLECVDGSQLLRTAWVSFGYGVNCTNLQAFSEIAKQLNVQFSPSELPVRIMPDGMTECRHAADILKTLCDEIDHEWSIQDGELVVLPRNVPDKTQAVVLRANTGLLGVPVKVEYRKVDGLSDNIKKGDVEGLHCEGRCLLNPAIRPGRTLLVSWRDVKDLRIVVNRVDFAGDSQEGAFECQWEGVVL